MKNKIQFIRDELLAEISTLLPKGEMQYVDIHGLPYCAGIKYLHDDGTLAHYRASDGQLEFFHYQELPVEALCSLRDQLTV